jgi:serine/threonine-protein kinase HipA
MSYDVYVGATRVGRLTAHRARLAFRYTEDVVAANGPALSLRLPPQLEGYGHDASEAYFANLLPEDEYRRLVARVVGQSDRNIAGLLGAIGGECAGAVSIWGVGEPPPAVPEYVPLDPDAVRRLLEADNVQGRLAVVRDARLSLAGGMEKLGLRWEGGQWFRSRRGAPTTHILKWPPTGYGDLAYNELFCLTLWRAAGIPVVEAKVMDVGTGVLVVRRYDRVEPPGGGLRLIHQEDLAQATGTHPGSKYQSEGGPGFAACAGVLRDFASVPVRERALLLRWGIANFLTGNEDAHAKNVALLHDVDGIRLAPFYDILCTQVYGSLKRVMAMAYGTEYRPAHLRRRHWDRFADDLEVPFRLVLREAAELTEAFERSLPVVRTELERRHGAHPVFALVEGVVTRQISRARTQLSGAEDQ